MKQKYLSEFPELLKQIHSKNGVIDPSKIKRGTAKELWWLCDLGHEWKAPVLRRTRGSGCPFCSGRNPTSDNCLNNNKSLIMEWHPKNTLTPKEVCISSGKKFWWLCNKGHEWQDTPDHRSKGRGCPMCSRRKVSPEINLEILYPEIAKEWHCENTIKPNEVLPKSTKKVWWLCSKNHKYECKICSRTNSGSGCNICSGHAVDETNCLSNKRPEIAKEWHPTKNGTISPNQISCGNDKRVWWQCSRIKCHEWIASVCSRTGKKNTDCPICRSSKGEKIIEEWLVNNNVFYQRQFKFDNCINKRKLPFDFAIFCPEIKLIEFQGEQHFQSVSYWGGKEKFEKIQKLDHIKFDFCNSHQIPLLIVPYWEKYNLPNILQNWISH